MSTVPIFYQGDVMLLNWGDTAASGRTVTFQLDDTDPRHPFKGVRRGAANGQRFKAVLVAIGDDELPTIAGVAQRSAEESPSLQEQAFRASFQDIAGDTPVPVKKAKAWGDLSPTAQAGIKCDEPAFQEWLGVTPDLCGTKPGEDLAAQIVRARCGVTSRTHLSTDPIAAAKWSALETDFSMRGYAR